MVSRERKRDQNLFDEVSIDKKPSKMEQQSKGDLSMDMSKDISTIGPNILLEREASIGGSLN